MGLCLAVFCDWALTYIPFKFLKWFTFTVMNINNTAKGSRCDGIIRMTPFAVITAANINLVSHICCLQMVRAFTQNLAQLDSQKGGKFSLFDGNVSGEFIDLVRYLSTVCVPKKLFESVDSSASIHYVYIAFWILFQEPSFITIFVCKLLYQLLH